MASRKDLTRGRLAEITGVNLETIRYYEGIGLMPNPDRTPAGHRVYGDGHRRRLSFIRRGRELGFGVEEVRALLGLAEPQRRSCDEVRAIAAAHLQDVRARIADLMRLESLLATTVDGCDARDAAPSCPVLDLLESS